MVQSMHTLTGLGNHLCIWAVRMQAQINDDSICADKFMSGSERTGAPDWDDRPAESYFGVVASSQLSYGQGREGRGHRSSVEITVGSELSP